MFAETYEDQYKRRKIIEGIDEMLYEKVDGVKKVKKISRFEASSFYIGYF